jgi:hypothetical protein
MALDIAVDPPRAGMQRSTCDGKHPKCLPGIPAFRTTHGFPIRVVERH